MRNPPAIQLEDGIALGRRRWRIAWLLGLGVLVNYFDRVNLSVSQDALYRHFGISDITFGYLSGAYNWTYALCQLPVGVMLDRFGVRRIGRISTLLWSVASFVAALAPGVGTLFGARLLLGIGEAPTFPLNGKAIGLWFPQSERSLSTSMFDAAAKLAPAIGVPILGLIFLHAGWRWSFACTGFISLGYAVLFGLAYRDPGEDTHLSARERTYIDEGQVALTERRNLVERASLGALMRQRKIIGLAIGFGSYNYTFYLLLVWLPRYLSSSLHIDLLHSFLYTGVPWLVATATDVGFGGILPDWLIARGANANRVRRTILILGTTCGLGLLGAAEAHTAVRALLWISLSIGGLAAAAPMGWSIITLISPRGSVGAVGGIINFASQLSGIAAAILTGYFVQAKHNFALAFAVAGVYLVVGVLAYVFLLGDIRRVETGSLSAT